MIGKGEEVKVGYDIKAAGNEVKNNIKSERQTLKQFLIRNMDGLKAILQLSRNLQRKNPGSKSPGMKLIVQKNIRDNPAEKRKYNKEFV